MKQHSTAMNVISEWLMYVWLFPGIFNLNKGQSLLFYWNFLNLHLHFGFGLVTIQFATGDV